MSDDLREFRSRINALTTSLVGVGDAVDLSGSAEAEISLTVGEIEELRWKGEYSGDMPYPRPATSTHVSTSPAPVYSSPSTSSASLLQVPEGTELIVINEGTGDNCGWSHIITGSQRGYVENTKITKMDGQLPSLSIDCSDIRSHADSNIMSPPWLQKAVNTAYFDASSATHQIVMEGSADLISSSTEGLADCLVDATFRGATLILQSLGKKNDKDFVLSLLKDYFISFQVADYNLSSRPGGALKVLVQLPHKYLPSIENGAAAASVESQDGGLYGYGGVAFYKMYEIRDLISFVDRTAQIIGGYQQQVDNFEGQTRGFAPEESASALRNFSTQVTTILRRHNIQPTQEGSIELGWDANRRLVMFLVNIESGPIKTDLQPFQSEAFTPTVMNYVMLSPVISRINVEEVGWVDFMATYSLDAAASVQAVASEDTASENVDETAIRNLRSEADQIPVKTLARTIEENRVFDNTSFREEAQRIVGNISDEVGGIQSRLSDILNGINSVEESYHLLLNRVSVDGLLAEALNCIAKQIPDYEEFANAADSTVREGFSKGRQLVGAASEAAGSIPLPDQDFFDAIPQMPSVPTLDFPDELPTNDLLEDYVDSIAAAILEAVTSVLVDGIKNILENVMASCDILDDTQAALTSPVPTDSQVERVRNELARQGMDDSSLDLFSFFDDVSNLLTPKEVCSLFTGSASTPTINLVIALMTRKHKPIATHLRRRGYLNKQTKDFFKSTGEILGTASFCNDIRSAFDTGGINDFCGDSTLRQFRQELLREKCVLTEEEIQQQLEREKERKLKTAQGLADLLANGISSQQDLSCQNPSSQIVPSSHHTFDYMLEKTVDNLFTGVYSSFSDDIKDYGPTLVSSVEKFSGDSGERELQGIEKQALPSFYDTISLLGGTLPYNNYRNQGYGSMINVRAHYESVPGFASETELGGGLSISDSAPAQDYSVGYILQPASIQNDRRYKVFILSGEDTLFHKELIPQESDTIAKYLDEHILTLDYLDEKDALIPLEQYSFSKLLMNSINSDQALEADADREAITSLFSHGAYGHSAAQAFSSLSQQILQSPLFGKIELPYNSPPPEGSLALQNTPLLIEHLDLSCISSVSCKKDNVLNLEEAKNIAKVGFCEVAPPTDPDELFSPFDKTMLESIIKTTIRIYTFDYFMRGFFVFSAIYSESSSGSADDSLAEFYFDKMVEEMVRMDSDYYSRFVTAASEIFMKDGVVESQNLTRDMLEDLRADFFIPEIKRQLSGIRAHVSEIIRFDTMREVQRAFLDNLNLYDVPVHDKTKPNLPFSDSSGFYHSRGFDNLSRLNWNKNSTYVVNKIISDLNKLLSDPSIVTDSILSGKDDFARLSHGVQVLFENGYWDRNDSFQAAFVNRALEREKFRIAYGRSDDNILDDSDRLRIRADLRLNFDRHFRIEEAMPRIEELREELERQQENLRFIESYLNSQGIEPYDATGADREWIDDTTARIDSLRGQIADVQRSVRETSSPEDLANGGLFLEQFIRITDWTPDEEEYHLVPVEIITRPSHLKGVLSLQAFRELLDMTFALWRSGIDFTSELEDAHLTPSSLDPTPITPPLFKNVEYGLRLVYVPPSSKLPAGFDRDVASDSRIIYPSIPVVSPPRVNLDPEISESELLLEETEDLLAATLAPSPHLLFSDPESPVYNLDFSNQLRKDRPFFEFVQREKLYNIKESREYVNPADTTTTISETIVLHPIRLVEVNSKLTGTWGELLSKENFGFSEELPGLLQQMLENDTYTFLTQFVFPLNLYENLLNFTNFITASDTPGVEEIFSTTKEQIKYSFDAISTTGERSYQQQDGSIVAAGGVAGVKEKMESLTGVLDSPNRERLQSTKGIGMGYIAKAALRAPLQIIKGQAEVVDPNIRISKRIQRKIREKGRDVPIGAISFPLSWFIPPTPFGIAYLGLGLGGFDSSSRETTNAEGDIVEEKTEMQLELENKGVSINASNCANPTPASSSPVLAEILDSEPLALLEEPEE